MARVQKFTCSGSGCRRCPKMEEAWRWGVKYPTEDGRWVWAWSELVCEGCAAAGSEAYLAMGHEVDTAGPGGLAVDPTACQAAVRLAGPDARVFP